ncbi:MAG: hypothetical protein ACLVL7_09195 [Anaerotruncus massiliensis (ex Togo et al. 2019)]
MAADFAAHREETVIDSTAARARSGSRWRAAAKVIGVEVVPQAVEKRSPTRAAPAFQRASAADARPAPFAGGSARRGHPRPPRKGCEEAVLESVARMAPGGSSWSPATAPRWPRLRRVRPPGYETVRCRPVDMFPRTAHVEAVVLLVKAET